MKDNTRDFSNSGYSNGADVASGFTSFVTEIFKNLKSFAIRLRDRPAQAMHQSDRNREMLNQAHQESSKRMPLEKLIRTGFYPF